jgi:Putative prokaryotic signal transducing protein
MTNIPDDVNTVQADDGTTWVEIASVGGGEEAKLLQGFLETEGITAQIEDVKFDMAPVNFGSMGEIRVYVSAGDEQRAMALLKERQVEYDRLDDDDETLVTDDGAATIDENSRAESDDGAES